MPAAVIKAPCPMYAAVLDAAEDVVLRRGIGKLTLETVARQAKLSKSGLIHHFPSKDALVEAMVARRVAEWKRDYEAAIASQPPGPGRVPRAFLGMCLADAAKWTSPLRRSGLVLVAALVHDPRHVEPLRRIHREVAALIERDGLPPGVGEAVMLAVDGLWFDWIFGITEIVPRRLAAIHAALEQLTHPQPAGQTSARAPRAPRNGTPARRSGKST
ncbi:MAG: TetR/AcrR family transcriptional regulator [Phycisphaerales bacterium]